MIEYMVSFEQANAHIFDVQLKVNFTLNKGQTFYLPNWIPGSYMIRDFSRNLVELKAESKGSEVKLEKLDKSTWQLLDDVDSLQVNYQVYAWDLSVRSAHLDNQHGFFNGTSLFLAIKGYENKAHQLHLKKSTLAQQNNWVVATSMSPVNIDTLGFGDYKSIDYDELIDHPFEFGDLTKVEFDVCGVPHKMFFTEAPKRVDWQRVANDVKKICETEVAFWGEEKPPFEQYVFMTFVQKQGFGGLEHRSSTALHCGFNDLPKLGENRDNLSSDYMTFLALCSHEYFHNWNVKRIKPARFIPMDMSQEVNTELLWFFEGITAYYDKLFTARSKVVKASDYLDMLARSITQVMRSKGRLKQSVTESSFDAWTKFYKQDENAINSIVSYYTKGSLVAFCLDFEIRRLTNQEKSLDDLMRHIWQNFGKKNIGLDEKQVQVLAEGIVGQSMNDFFNHALYSTNDVDLEAVFDLLDINYQLIPQYFNREKGGFTSEVKQRKTVAFLGLIHKSDSLGAKIHSVVQGSCGAEAGLSNSDIIIAIDDIRVTSSELDQTIAAIPINETIKISYFRRERLYHVECQLTASDDNTCYLSYKSQQPSENVLAWLNYS